MAKRIPVMMTINKTAERVGLSPFYIRKLCLENKICFVKAGNKYMINLGKLIDYLNGEGETPAPALAVGGIRDLSKC